MQWGEFDASVIFVMATVSSRRKWVIVEFWWLYMYVCMRVMPSSLIHVFRCSCNWKVMKNSLTILQVVAISHEEVPDKICNYDLCVVRMMQIDSSVIDRAKRLKLLMQFGVGLEGRENVLVIISLFLGNNCT
jgi:hypothetical protein